MKTLRSTVVLLVMTILASLTLGSCSKKDETAEFINGLKECSVKAENAKNVQDIAVLKADMNTLLDKYATSKAPITDEQKTQIADILTETLSHIAPLSVQGLLSPDDVDMLLKQFHEELAAKLSNVSTLGQFITDIKAAI